MKRLLSLAAVAGIMMSAIAAPLPVMAKDGVPNCAVLPLLKAECRAKIRDAAGDVGAATVVATGTVVTVTSGVVVDAVDSVTGWRCERTRGGKALFSCSK
jgi:hypothetical protein